MQFLIHFSLPSRSVWSFSLSISRHSLLLQTAPSPAPKRCQPLLPQVASIWWLCRWVWQWVCRFAPIIDVDVVVVFITVVGMASWSSSFGCAPAPIREREEKKTEMGEGGYVWWGKNKKKGRGVRGWWGKKKGKKKKK
jgi:hypothetical protein